MKRMKRGLAMFLTVAMTVTLLPETAFAYAAEETEQVEATQEEPKTEQVQELENAREVVEEYTIMTVDQPLSHTEKGEKEYLFQPQESGWYRFTGESVSDCTFDLSHDKTLYYTEDNVENSYNIYQGSGSAKTISRIMWLNAAERYFFRCTPSEYADDHAIDINLCMSKADITKIEMLEKPTDTSYDCVYLSGMQVKISFENGSSILATATNHGWSGYSSYDYLEEFEWNPAFNAEERIYTNLNVTQIDGSDISFAELEDGSHEAMVQLSSYKRNEEGNMVSYERPELTFRAEFEVQKQGIEAVEVVEAKTEYTQGFNEYLSGDLKLKIKYKDGREETVTKSEDWRVNQVLVSNAAEGEYSTSSIDDYLTHGGAIGETEVMVTYKGVSTSYKITIKENPYERMELKPNKTTYYTNCGVQDGDITYTGDYIEEYDMSVVLYLKDGSSKEYNSIWDLPNIHYRSYGVIREDENGTSYYTNIDEYIAAGGTVGTQKVRLECWGLTAETEIEIVENPYDHITILEAPKKQSYLHNAYGYPDLTGLEIRAYKDAEETAYDDYNYDTEEGAVSNWKNNGEYFRTTLGGHDNLAYLELGTHPVSVYLMGKKAAYDITIVDKLAESISIEQAPERLEYFVGEKYLQYDGLVLQVTDLDGNVKKYRYQNGASDEYEDWWDISDDVDFDYDIDWNTEGTYPVTVSYLGCSAEFDITVQSSPVVSLEITKAPLKNEYFQFESDNIDLRGMSYRIQYIDGTTASGTVDVDTNSLGIQYQGKWYYLRAAWEKKNSFDEAAIGNNMFRISFIGQSALTDTITVKADPIKSLEVIRKPEKMEYVGHGAKVDLYGAIVRITYTDGTSKDINITEHTDRVIVDDAYKYELYANLSYGGSKKYLFFNYMNAAIDIEVSVDMTKLNAIPLEEEAMVKVTLNQEQPYQVYSFTPSVSGERHFYSLADRDTYVELYEGNKLIDSDDDGGNGNDFKMSAQLKAGVTYYYVVSMLNSDYFENYDKEVNFSCCFSSEVTDISALAITDFKILKVPRDTWYEFESGNIWADNLTIEGTKAEITYENGWVQELDIQDEYEEIQGEPLSVRWKYTTTDEDGDEYAEKREDNKLVYSWGDMQIEVPVQFNVETPVASLEIKNNPITSLYEYQLRNYEYDEMGLSVLVHYKDGRKDDVLTWEAVEDGDVCAPSLNGYRASVDTWWSEDNYQITDGAMNISYMGVTLNVNIAVKPNPVTGIQIIKAPDKMGSYPYESNYGLDLYGLQVLVTYRGGTTQQISVNEHTDRFYVDNAYKTYLRGDISWSWDYTQNQSIRQLYVTYAGGSQTVGKYEEKGFADLTEVGELSLGESVKVAFDKETKYRVFRFVPTEAGTYTFTAEENGVDSYVSLYSSSGMYLESDDDGEGTGWNFKLSYEMIQGKTYYLVMEMYTGEGEYTCTAEKGEEIEKQTIEKINLNLPGIQAGQYFWDAWDLEDYNDYEEYSISSVSWYGDTDYDDCADYGTAHRVKLVLSPRRSYRFAYNTQLNVNGAKVVEKSVGSDGRMTLYYTLPYTACLVSFMLIPAGYELDESQNAALREVNYGGDYKFSLVKTDENAEDKLIVKANDTVLKQDADGFYTISKVKENTEVYIKTEDMMADEVTGSKLTLYNQSSEIYDIVTGDRYSKLADNTYGERTLPVLESYADGSDQFFYGWYQDKDDNFNGTGSRFTSQSTLELPVYSLYAKYSSGLFTTRLNNKEIHYKVLSIDEFNKLRVQVGDGVNAAAKTLLTKTRGIAAYAAEDGGVLEIPSKVAAEDLGALTDLGIDVGECQVVAIAENAFAGDTGISAVKLPETIEQIGSNAFKDCSSLTSVELPEAVKKIQEGTFDGCTSLASVSIPEGVSSIEANAFKGCGSLATVTLPNSLESIDTTAFTGESQELTLVCSSQMAESEMVKGVQETTGAKVKVVDVELDYNQDEKSFTYGDEAQSFTASVKEDGQTTERVVKWSYPETDAYTFEVTGNIIQVTPNRATTQEENIVITATDEASGKSRSISLKTEGIDLETVDTDGDCLYSVSVLNADGLVYSGIAICPVVVVKENLTGKTVDASNYEVEYSNNINAGMAGVTVIGSGNYTGELQTSFHIAKKQQTITAQSSYAKTVGDGAFNLGVVTDGDGGLVYRSNNTQVATVSNHGLVTIVGAGTAEITINAPETGNYTATAKKVTITVNKKAQTITAGNVTKTYGDGAFNLGAKASGTLSYASSNTKVATVNGNGLVTLTGAGTATITINAAATATENAATKNVTITVNKKAQTITAQNFTKEYGNAEFTIGAKADGNGTLSYSTNAAKVATVNNAGKVTVKGVGTAQITIRAAETSNYKAAVKTITVKVGKGDAKLKVKQPSATKAYGSKSFSLGASAKAKITYKTSSKKVATVSTKGKVTIKGCGKAVITVTTGDSKYKTASKKITIKVVPKKAKIKSGSSKKAGQLTISWSKQTEADGYVVQYTTDKRFKKSIKTVTIKKNKTTSTILKGLSKGKKYYVRVKAYKTIDKKKAYGEVSKSVTKTVKKK